MRSIIRDEIKAGGGGTTTIVQQSSKGKGTDTETYAGQGTPVGEIEHKPKVHNVRGDGTPAQGSNSKEDQEGSQDTKAEMGLNADGGKTLLKTKDAGDDGSLTTVSSVDNSDSSSTCSSSSDDEDNLTFPNPWAKFR